MKTFLHKTSLLASMLLLMSHAFAQSGSGWDWASTSTKATPSTGRQIRDIVTDAGGNVYAVGDFEGSMTLGSATLTTTGDGTSNYNYDADAFVVKYDGTGKVLWAKQYGRSGTSLNDRGEVIALDGNGNIYIGGNAGVPFLRKYDNNGNLLWSKSFTLYDLGGINISPDGNPIIMESNQSAKNIYKINKTTGNILWTVANTGVGSNSTTTYQDFVDQAGNVYYTAFGTGSVTVAGSNYSSSVQGTSYIASVDNSGVTRWVDQLEGAQVQLGYTIDKNGNSYVVIGGGFGGTFQGTLIGGCAACGNHYLEINAAGTLTYSSGESPYKGVMRVTDNGIFSYGINAGSSSFRYTEVYGDNIVRSRAANGEDLGVIAKYDRATRQPVWANTYEVNGNNYLNTIEPTATGKCLAGGSYSTTIKFGASTYTATVTGQSYFNPLDFFIAQFTISNVTPSPTTTWTGSANNGNWDDAANWSNGAPAGVEKTIIPAGKSNYPINILTSNATGKLTIQNGVSITLPVDIDIPLGIVNDGNIEVKGTGTFQGFNTNYAAILSGNGKLIFTANSPSAIFYNINNSLEINKPGGTIESLGGTISGSLFLTAGVFKGSNPVILTNPNAAITYSATGYMAGTLKRAISSSGTFVFPVSAETQYSGGPTVYAPVSITLNNVTGPQYISVSSPGFSQAAGAAPNINMGGSNTITSILNNKNYWIVTPDVAVSGGSYSVTLQGGGYTNGVTDASKYVVIKRASDNAPWSFDGTNGTSTQTGGSTSNGVVSNGTVIASASNLTSFSTFAIGIASASVPPGTSVTTSNWTGNTGTAWNDAGNWDNGIPNGLVNAKIPGGKQNYPQVYIQTDNARTIQNDAISTVKLPYNFNINADIINNGTIEITGANSATFKGFGPSSGYAPLSGTGKLLFTNNSPGIFSGTFNNSVEVNRTTNFLYAQSVYVGGSFNIVSGNVFTSYLGNETFITMLSAEATVTATPTYPVQGTLTRTINPSGTYSYPVGEGPTRYAPVTITTNNIAGTTRISAQYYSTLYGFRKFTPADNQPTYALDAGQWTITPNSSATAGMMNITLEGRGYTNGVTDASRYVLLRSSGDTNWVKVDNATITENAGVITASANNLPALTVQTVYIIGIKGTTTQWTGAANNQSWTTSANWTNGVPDNTNKAAFVGGSPNYPASVTVSNTAAMLDIAAGATLTLPQNLNIPQGILNNGTIEVKGSNPFAGFNGGSTTLSGKGKLLFSAASPSSISSSAPVINNGIELNRTGNFTVSDLSINGTLTLTSGIMTGNVNLTDANAALTYNTSSYINGMLNRAVNTSGKYSFPIGTADRFVPIVLSLNNLTGTQNITASFSSTINGAAPNTTAHGVPVTQLLNTGIWTVTPNVQPSTGNYTITLEGRNYTNGVSDPARYVVLKRDAYYYDWTFKGFNGMSAENAGVANATAGQINRFSDFAIGIANSAVGVALPVTLAKFEVIKNNETADIAWQTAAEINTDKFVLQRSSNNVSFTDLAEVKAQGTSNQMRSYLYKDKNPLQGLNYYRLQQVDKDGKTTYSETKLLKFNSKDVQVSVYPNPVHDILRVRGVEGQKVWIELISTLGQVVLQQPLLDNHIKIPAGLGKGLYKVKITNSDKETIIKTVLID